MNKTWSNNRGLSLVEVVVSVAVLGILSVPIFGLLNINIKLNNKSKDLLIATNIAEDNIETMKYSDNIVLGEKTSNKDGFIVNTMVQTVEQEDSNYLYRLIVEVKKDEKVIERLFTYKSSREP